MSDPFRHLHMSPELACEFLAVFSRAEYALKATDFASESGGRVTVTWDKFANAIDEDMQKVGDENLAAATEYLLTKPPRKQIRENGVLLFVDQEIDRDQKTTQQLLLMVRTVRNNLFHGGKYLPSGEVEEGRNEALVRHSLTVLDYCMRADDQVSECFEA